MTKRSTEEVIILILSGAISLGILPFVLIRVYQGSWTVALLDGIAITVTTVMFLYVWISHNTQLARWVIAGLCVTVMTTTIFLKGAAQILWVYPALTALFFLIPIRVALVIAGIFLFTVTAMVRSELDTLGLAQFLVSSFTTLLFCYAFADRMYANQKQLLVQATIDTLTGVGNRRALEEHLLNLLARFERGQVKHAAILMIDLDHFKEINDQFGHNVGDQVLQIFTKTLSARVRNTDKVYRYGGEEFVVIAEQTNLDEAKVLAQAICDTVAHVTVRPLDKITVSIGIADYANDKTGHQWLQRADTALYKAKKDGRNTCRTA